MPGDPKISMGTVVGIGMVILWRIVVGLDNKVINMWAYNNDWNITHSLATSF